MRLPNKYLRSNLGQTLVEITLIAPMLLALGFGVIEATNMINSYLVLTHLTREGANIASREPGTKGSTAWATSINSDLNTVVTKASPVINPSGTGGTGPSQFKVIYSLVDDSYNRAAGACGGGNLSGGQQDFYRIRRSNTGWTGSVTWEYGTLSQTSGIGNDGECAYLKLPEVKNLSTTGIRLHVIEVFYNYAPSKLTPAAAFIGALAPGIFYKRTVFMDVVG
ncbi:MAG TPA: TadE family protein [Candidatus Binatia bacterium]|jgi:hypothetical protein